MVGTKKAKIRVIIPEKKKTAITAPDSNSIADKEQQATSIGDHQPDKQSDDKIKKAGNEVADTSFQAPMEKEADPSAPLKIDNGIDEVQMEKLAAMGTEGLMKITLSISDDAVVAVTPKNGKLYYSVSGGNSAVLIGKRGQTLEAIQYLIDKIINKSSAKRVKVEVDVEGYREKRKANLKKMAKRLAEKVRKTGKPVSAGQMNSHDRRIVHLTLKNDNSVRTQSMGDGHIRKLVIFPKGGSNRSRGAKTT